MKLKIYFSMLSIACVSVLGYTQNFEDLEIIPDYEMSLIGADISMDEVGMKFKNVLYSNLQPSRRINIHE